MAELMTSYEHTQRGWWHVIFLGMALVMLIGSWLAQNEPAVVVLNLVIAGIFVVTALMCGSLTVRDEGDRLALRFGPLPVLRKRIRYSDISAVEPDKIRVIDGWGIHYIIGRGWTYNLWGFDCVKVALGKKVIRIGTDDVAGLNEFLRKRTERPTSATGCA